MVNLCSWNAIVYWRVYERGVVQLVTQCSVGKFPLFRVITRLRINIIYPVLYLKGKSRSNPFITNIRGGNDYKRLRGFFPRWSLDLTLNFRFRALPRW